MGYRARMTLAFGILSVASLLLLTLVFLLTSYQEFKLDRMLSIERMTACLAGNEYWDVRAGETDRVNESLKRFSEGVPAPTPPGVLLLGLDGRVQAAHHAEGLIQNAELMPLTEARFQALNERLDVDGQSSATIERDGGFMSAARIARDEDVRGTVLLDYPLSSLQAHFVSLFSTAVGYGLLLVLALLAFVWVLGKRLVAPITQLRECMSRVGKGDLDVRCGAVQSRDEIGELAQGFDEMLAGLREKRLLEEEMLHTKRLVAVGQLAAGVAHEINNPLGGMLNAVNTFKRHGQDPAVASRTLDLLERGLKQIQSTVQALLVQARVQASTLGVADLEDVRTLVQSEVAKKELTLDWRCGVVGDLPLPAAAIRQIMINLLLNAIAAAPPRGKVGLHCEPEPGHLWLRVEDDGPGIPDRDREKVFEPFFSGTGGHGLGLWVTYQTLSQLGGSIEVLDLEPGTAMEIRLPYLRDETRRSASVTSQAAAVELAR